MEREFFYLFCVVDRPGVYRLGITADLEQEQAEGGMGLHPCCRRRPRRKAGEVQLLASFWLGPAAGAVRDEVWKTLGRPVKWGNAQVELNDHQLEQVVSVALAAACKAVRLPAGFVAGRSDLGDWEFQCNAGLEDAVRATCCQPLKAR